MNKPNYQKKKSKTRKLRNKEAIYVAWVFILGHVSDTYPVWVRLPINPLLKFQKSSRLPS